MTKLQKYLESGLIFKHNGKLSRKCPICSKIISNDNKRASEILMNGINNSCNECRIKTTSTKLKFTMLGEKNHFFGKHHTDESKEKNRLSHLGKTHTDEWKLKMSRRMKENHPFKDKHHTDQTKLKIQKAKSGINHNMFGKKCSDETIRKMRVAIVKRLEKYGLYGYEDVGAREFFQNQNESGFRFIENYSLKDLGYIVDGYDPYQHIICEFDTPYHKKLSRKQKDIKRQENIMKYFEMIGNPLKGFIRIDSQTLSPYNINLCTP